MVTSKKEMKFNHDNTVTISIHYTFDTADFVTDELPESCAKCPVGFMYNYKHVECGNPNRKSRIPDGTYRNERAPGCRLRTIDQWLKEQKK